MPRTRVSVALYLVLVFGSGILVGVVSHRLYVTTTVSATAAAPRNMGELRRKYLDDMRAKVGVNQQQLDSVNRILDDSKRKFDELNASEKVLHDKIHQEMIDDVSALLTPQQKISYDKWREERARLHQLQQQQNK
jgi:uncharacterized protein YnzC (UPF0291/DUF896 family)